MVKLITLIHTKLIKFNHTKIGSYILGADILLLETKGIRTNKLRKVPLTYTEIDEGYLVAASFGGRDRSPSWFYNIRNNSGFVTVNKKKYEITAEIVKEDESEYFWNELLKIYPTFQIYRDRTDRKIPLIKLIKV